MRPVPAPVARGLPAVLVRSSATNDHSISAQKAWWMKHLHFEKGEKLVEMKLMKLMKLMGLKLMVLKFEVCERLWFGKLHHHHHHHHHSDSLEKLSLVHQKHERRM